MPLLVFQLLYLRRFKQLQTLNLSGNPICQADEFRQYTIAYLPSIQFLDYRLVDEQSVSYATFNAIERLLCKKKRFIWWRILSWLGSIFKNVQSFLCLVMYYLPVLYLMLWHAPTQKFFLMFRLLKQLNETRVLKYRVNKNRV